MRKQNEGEEGLRNWRYSYDFLPIFYINTLLVSVISNFLCFSNHSWVFFLSKLVASLVSGITFDYLPTKFNIVGYLILGAGLGIWEFWALAIVSPAIELITLSYVAEMVTDNCKYRALSDILAIQLIGGSIGKILNIYIQPGFLAQIFFPSACFILAIVNIATFQEARKSLRPNYISHHETTVYPKSMALTVSFLVIFTTGTVLFLARDFFANTYFGSPSLITEVFSIICVPIGLYYISFYHHRRDLRIITLASGTIGTILFLLFILNYIFYGGLAGVYLSFPIARAAGFAIFARILGPFYYGKFFALAMAGENLMPLLNLTDWWTIYILCIIFCFLSFGGLSLFYSQCDCHRDYVIGHTISLGGNKRAGFKIKLKRASVLVT